MVVGHLGVGRGGGWVTGGDRECIYGRTKEVKGGLATKGGES